MHLLTQILIELGCAIEGASASPSPTHDNNTRTLCFQ